MTKLPILSGKEVAKRLEQAGFVFVRQGGVILSYENRSRQP